MVHQWVVDASVLIQGYIQETGTTRVESLLASTLEPEAAILHVPEFCLLECANILWKRAHLYRHPVEEIEQALTYLIAAPLTVYPAANLLPRALIIGVNNRLAIYDAIYITLAETLNCPLITVDERQASAATAVGVGLKPLSDFPEFKRRM